MKWKDPSENAFHKTKDFTGSALPEWNLLISVLTTLFNNQNYQQSI